MLKLGLFAAAVVDESDGDAGVTIFQLHIFKGFQILGFWWKRYAGARAQDNLCFEIFLSKRSRLSDLKFC